MSTRTKQPPPSARLGLFLQPAQVKKQLQSDSIVKVGDSAVKVLTIASDCVIAEVIANACLNSMKRDSNTLEYGDVVMAISGQNADVDISGTFNMGISGGSHLHREADSDVLQQLKS
ncbi:MAG: hypothetical protein JSS82_03975 [Bacteroidetes bacterium]|nr:hypothetical protein [Bacteroidota bacterium]